MVGYLGLPPYIIHDPVSDTFDGADLRLVEVISGHFRFRYRLQKESGWLYKDERGRWKGAVGDVSDGIVQLRGGFIGYFLFLITLLN